MDGGGRAWSRGPVLHTEMGRGVPHTRIFGTEYEREGNVSRHKKNLNITVYSVSEVKPAVSTRDSGKNKEDQ